MLAPGIQHSILASPPISAMNVASWPILEFERLTPLQHFRFSGLVSGLFNDQQAAGIEQFKGSFG